MTTHAIRLEGVSKTWPGGGRGLDGMSFQVPRGSVCGFVGPNGAGKTTTFSILSGFLRADAGTVDLLGLGPFDPWTMKGRVGVLPQDAELPGLQTPQELLEHLGRLQGLASPRHEALRWLEAIDLGERARHRIRSLSHGMRRRVAVATALLGSPELVLLDEPTAGLDPVQARRVRGIIREIQGDRTVVVSSHNLLELETLADWVVSVREGRCVGEGTVAQMTGQTALLTWVVCQPPERAEVEAHGGSLDPDGRTIRVRVGEEEDIDRVSVKWMGLLAQWQVGLVSMRRGVGLEERVVGERSDLTERSGRGSPVEG